jgi:hypothetical protein
MNIYTIETIREPFWKYLAFGIALFLFEEHGAIQTRCSYRYLTGSKRGQLQFPHMYRIDSVKVLAALNMGRYHKMVSKKGVDLVIIPISEFEIVPEEALV